MANRLTRKVGLYFIGNLSTRILGAAIIPVYAFAVSPSELGRYDYILTIGQLAAPLAFVAIWESALRFLIIEPTSDSVKSSMSTIVIFSISISLSFTVLALTVGWALSINTANLIGLVMIALLYGLVQVWQYFARAEQETRLYVVSGIASAIVTFALVIGLVVAMRLGFAGLLIAYVAGQFITVAIIEFRMRVIGRTSFQHFDRRLLIAMLRYSGPLVVNLLAVGLLGGFGRILIYNTMGDAANGVYSFAMKFATIVVSLGTVISMSVIEEGLLRSSSSKVGEFYSRVLNSLISALILFITALVPVLYLFFRMIQGTEYSSARDLVPILLLFAVFSVLGTQFGSIFMTVGKTGALGTSTFIGAVATVVASILLIRPIGLSGVAAALLIGSMVMMVLRFKLSRRQLEYSVSAVRAFGLSAAYLIASFSCFLAAQFAAPWVTAAMTVVIPCACAWPFINSLRAIKEIPDEIEV